MSQNSGERKRRIVHVLERVHGDLTSAYTELLGDDPEGGIISVERVIQRIKETVDYESSKPIGPSTRKKTEEATLAVHQDVS